MRGKETFPKFDASAQWVSATVRRNISPMVLVMKCNDSVVLGT